MSYRHIAFFLAAATLAFVVFLPGFGMLGDQDIADVGLLTNKRLSDVVRNPWSSFWCWRYLLIVLCAYVMVRLQVAAGTFELNQGKRWTKKGVVKVYGDPHWSRTKTTVIVILSVALVLLLAAIISLGAGLAAIVILLFGSIGGTGFRLIVDDVGVEWNGILFTWGEVESWTLRHVPAHYDESNGHGETWYLSVRFKGNRTVEQEDAKRQLSQPFHEYAAAKFQEAP